MTFVAPKLGGSAGAVVASRLSDIPEWKVLLLEAGPDEPPGAEVPSMVAMFLGKFQLDLPCTQPCPLRGNEHSGVVPESVSIFISFRYRKLISGVPGAKLENAGELAKIKSPRRLRSR